MSRRPPPACNILTLTPPPLQHSKAETPPALNILTLIMPKHATHTHFNLLNMLSISTFQCHCSTILKIKFNVNVLFVSAPFSLTHSILFESPKTNIGKLAMITLTFHSSSITTSSAHLLTIPSWCSIMSLLPHPKKSARDCLGRPLVIFSYIRTLALGKLSLVSVTNLFTLCFSLSFSS